MLVVDCNIWSVSMISIWRGLSWIWADAPEEATDDVELVATTVFGTAIMAGIWKAPGDSPGGGIMNGPAAWNWDWANPVTLCCPAGLCSCWGLRCCTST